MPTKTCRIPKYRHHKAKNLAVVTIDGKDVYLGRYDSPASHEDYRKTIAEWLSAQGSAPIPAPETVQGFWGVSSFIESYLGYAQQLYSKDGQRTSEYHCMVSALDPLNQLFGSTNIHEFGPRKLKLVRDDMIRRNWSRNVVNGHIHRIRRAIKWAVAEQLVSPTLLEALKAVPGLRYGKSEARETEPVSPVADEHVAATLPYLTPVVAAMVQVQRLTGMRPGELVIMRPADIDRRGDVWFYAPTDHKTKHRGHSRRIAIGPKAQEVLRPYLDRPDEAYLFSPIESEQQRNAERRKNRKSPMTPSQAKRKPKSSPQKPKRPRFDRDSYRRAIKYAIKQANKKQRPDELQVPEWHPHQLRHTRATEVREKHGLDGAQSVLGHRNADVTQVYAERNDRAAAEIAMASG